MQYSTVLVLALAALAQSAAVKPAVTITAGTASIGANKLGCAHIKPAGKGNQLVCTSDFTANGFSLSVKDESTKVRTTCNVKGTSGTCGPSGAGARISVRDLVELETREPHHTEKQIAHKEALAAAASSSAAAAAGTAAPVAAAKPKAKKGKGKKACARQVDLEAREAHHTEKQIAQKKAGCAREVDE